MKRSSLAALFLVLAACGQPERAASPAERSSPPASQVTAEHEAGRRIYNYRCYFCHGYSGDSRTLAARMIEPAPRDFTRSAELGQDRIAAAVRHGLPGTAMASFANVLPERDIDLVARFVAAEFVTARAPNTRYHTRENGWPEHERYASAFVFATGEVPLDRPEVELSPSERQGKRLFMGSCVTCHDRSNVIQIGPAWSGPLSPDAARASSGSSSPTASKPK